jgi:hypothetical protein
MKSLVTGHIHPQTGHIRPSPDISDLRPDISGTTVLTIQIQFMIEPVAQKKFYKEVHHDSLRPAVPKDPRASHTGSSAAPAAAPSRTTRSGGAPSTPATNSGILKML